MSSQFRFFFVRAGEPSNDELNRFLKSHKIVRVTDNFVSNGSNSGYHFLVEYYDESSVDDNAKSKRVDYRSLLKTDEEKVLFDNLKQFRAELCKKEKLVAAYIVCKDEHLYAMVCKPTLTKEEISSLPHSGNIKLADYASDFEKKLKELCPEGGSSDNKDSILF